MNLTNVKMFNKIYIAYKGTLKFKLYLDGSEVAQEDLSSVNLAVQEIKIAQGKSRAYYFQFEIYDIQADSKLYNLEIDDLKRQTAVE